MKKIKGKKERRFIYSAVDIFRNVERGGRNMVKVDCRSHGNENGLNIMLLYGDGMEMIRWKKLIDPNIIALNRESNLTPSNLKSKFSSLT